MRTYRLIGAILAVIMAISAVGVMPLAAAADDGEGCRPIFWARWHNLDEWTDYKPWHKFKDVFDSDAFGEKRLYRVLTQWGTGKRALGRHTVAALLNAAHPEVNYRGAPGEQNTIAQEVIVFWHLWDGRTNLRYFREGNRAYCPLR